MKEKKNGKANGKHDEGFSNIPRFDIAQETKNSIWGIVGIILAVVSLLSFMNGAGPAGEMFNSLARSLFGWGFFIIPVAFLLLGISFIKSLSRQIYFSAIFGTLLFVLSFLGLFFIFGSGEFAERLSQGGYLGVILGYPLLRSVGFTASAIILLAFALIAVLVALNISLGGLLFKKKEEEKPMDKVVVKRGDEVIEPNKKPVFEAKPLSSTPQAKPEMTDKELVIKNLKRGKWTLPPVELLNEDHDEAVTGDINANAMIIKKTLANFGIDVEMGEVSIGPTVTQYTLRPAVGVKLSRISALNP